VTASGERDEVAEDSFSQALSAGGYDPQHEDVYATRPGVMPKLVLPPRLFAAADLDILSLESFKDDRLPKMVRAVSYELEVVTDPLDALVSKDTLARLLTTAPLGGG